MRVIDAKFEDDILTVETQESYVGEGCPYKEGEKVQLDTRKMRVIGTVFWKLGNIFKMKVKNNEVFVKSYGEKNVREMPS